MPLAALNLQKHSNKDNLQSLEGAVYNLYTENDEYIQKLITDEHGNAKTDAILKKGTYYLKEITAPKGYELDQEKHYITVNATDDTIDINLIDDVIESELTILKETYLEGSNPQVEEGVVFNIYDINNDLYAAITTDQNGFAKVSLVYGTYTIKQENTKEGYKKVNDFVVTIDEESNKEIFYSLIDEAITEYVKITKVDKNDNPIKNNSASFKIFDIDNNKDLCLSLEGENICEFKTDASGEILIPFKVPYGIYQLIETKAPTGYKKMDSMNFTIDGSGELLTLIVKNDPIEASLHIKKIDDKEHPLENVSFAIYTDQDELVSIELTNEIGEVDIVLPFGKYYFKEYISLDGYQIDEKKYYLNIDGNKETFNYVIVNVPKTGKDKSYALDIVSVITGIVLCIKRLKDCYS